MKTKFTFEIVADVDMAATIVAHVHRLTLNPRVQHVSGTFNPSVEYIEPELNPAISSECTVEEPVLMTSEQARLFRHLQCGDAERDSMLEAMLLSCEHTHIMTAIEAIEQGHSNKSIIYLMGGNNPATNPFASEHVG